MAAALPVHLENVTKRFSRGGEEVAVLNGINLEIPPGDFVALMGPSGSGKSTLLNLIAGLDRPTTGKVKIGDREPGQMSDNELCDWRSHTVGFIFQKYHLLNVLTAAQNVEVPLLCFKMAKSERERRVKTALELVGLADRMNHYPRQLSGGQEQRVAIARSLVTDPALLICDEPTGDLDAKAAAEVMQLLTLLNTQLKKTIVMVTHDPKAAQKARRVLSLEKGVIAARA